MSGEAYPSVSILADSNSEIASEWLETGSLAIRLGTVFHNGRLILQGDAAKHLYAALGEALKASEPHTMERAA